MSVVGYDQLDHVIYTGKWKTSLDEDALREYFNNVDNKNSPSVDELTPGTVTRTFYDRMPARDTLGVELYPPSAIVSVSTYTFGNDFHGLNLCGSTMLVEFADKVTENFTGKERDDETELNYFGARYLDPMLGVWTSIDPKRQYQNSFIYAGNNPIMRIDPDGNLDANAIGLSLFMDETLKPQMQTAFETGVDFGEKAIIASSVATIGVLSVGAVAGAAGSGMITAGYERALCICCGKLRRNNGCWMYY
ncbi:RHS repeat-associated core domain-containing protein [uncultured Fibrobacter sp.]|uniref:RHS repeat-associated core domain-containing protein n=1 Tax=uncultured Fibrobacter sp. TaxID=261512 RepID=UPI0025F390B2|nr:RHS repeat-associated core domain-containing protein [uncultured Fibrobacter sp.]